MAESYLDPAYAPEAVAEKCGIPAQRIRKIANELARVAFDEAFDLGIEWTDFRGETHAKMTGRPVSFHAMRGISAHANGFQTCRALHVLQILLGTVEVPGGFPLQTALSRNRSRRIRHPIVTRNPIARSTAHIWDLSVAPNDLGPQGRWTVRQRIDKAFTWENPMSAHGLMHMVISNAHAGDPYKIDTLFMYMANMSWNSSA